MTDFFIKVKQQEALHLPYVIFKKPNKNKLIGYFQNNDHLYFAEDLSEKGFVFAPFDESQMILIPKNETVKWESHLTSYKDNYQSDIVAVEDKVAKAHYEALVQKGIDGIKNGLFDKVVLSRMEIVGLSDFEVVSVFKRLIQSYPTAFCYCWFHPKIGLWIGATPERLLKASKKRFYTMALAGTQSTQENKEVVWEKKEIEEQQFVTDYILDNLKNVTSEISVSNTYTLQAGDLLHLKTDIKGVINSTSSLKEVVSILNPTPAVCGLPKRSAKDFIIENEGYDRRYYTGFLGELNMEGISTGKSKTDLYVNLRCMQIETNQAHLFMGCGITKDSIPEKEWNESVHKSMTMKRVL